MGRVYCLKDGAWLLFERWGVVIVTVEGLEVQTVTGGHLELVTWYTRSLSHDIYQELATWYYLVSISTVQEWERDTMVIKFPTMWCLMRVDIVGLWCHRCRLHYVPSKCDLLIMIMDNRWNTQVRGAITDIVFGEPGKLQESSSISNWLENTVNSVRKPSVPTSACYATYCIISGLKYTMKSQCHETRSSMKLRGWGNIYDQIKENDNTRPIFMSNGTN